MLAEVLLFGGVCLRKDCHPFSRLVSGSDDGFLLFTVASFESGIPRVRGHRHLLFSIFFRENCWNLLTCVIATPLGGK